MSAYNQLIALHPKLSTNKDVIKTKRGGGRGEEVGVGIYLCILNDSGIAKYWGEKEPGRTTAREWRRPGLLPSCENPLNKKPRTKRGIVVEENLGRAS